MHSLAVDRAGVLWSWGIHRHGELGREFDGDFDSLPARVDLPRPVVAVAGGMEHTVAVDAG